MMTLRTTLKTDGLFFALLHGIKRIFLVPAFNATGTRINKTFDLSEMIRAVFTLGEFSTQQQILF